MYKNLTVMKIHHTCQVVIEMDRDQLFAIFWILMNKCLISILMKSGAVNALDSSSVCMVPQVVKPYIVIFVSYLIPLNNFHQGFYAGLCENNTRTAAYPSTVIKN